MEKTNTATVAVVESALVRGAEDYFRANDFVHVPSVPHIVSVTGACENIDTLFTLDYFGAQGFLTQTGQLYLETLIKDLKNVCCVIHSFRAEPKVDGRHLTEFPLVEFEFSYDAEEENGLMNLLDHIEGTICTMVKSALKNALPQLKELGADIQMLRSIERPFQRISYTQAIRELQQQCDIEWGADLTHEHEQFLVRLHGNKPLFITHYPERIKFFNMRRNREHPEVVNSADLILPSAGEAVGSAEREHNYDVLMKKLTNSSMYKRLLEKGGSLEDFKWYLDTIKENPVPHAGCGIGLSRVTQFVLGKADIREATPYPMNRESLKALVVETIR